MPKAGKSYERQHSGRETSQATPELGGIALEWALRAKVVAGGSYACGQVADIWRAWFPR